MLTAFFLHLPGNADLLKAELAQYKGDCRPSFLAPGFSTFIIDEKFKEELTKRKPALCLCYGFNAVRVDREASVWIENDELVFNGEKEFLYRDKKNNIWFGESNDFSTVVELANIKIPQESPSRAWLKIAQAFKLFPKKRHGNALEIGSSPGGAAYFLLSEQLILTGVDPGNMDPSILKNDHFNHIKKPVQDLAPKDLQHKFKIIAVDTNLPAAMSIKETLRVAYWSIDQLEELFITIKLPNPKLVSKLKDYKHAVSKLGFKSQFIQLPAHHREILLYASKRTQ